jgi:hypothetical protein
MRKIKHITLGYSSLAAWRRCATSFKYRYLNNYVRRSFAPNEQQLRKAKGSALTFGSLIHEALELWHGGKSNRSEEILNIISPKIDERLGHIPPDNDRSAQHCKELITAYINHYDAQSDFLPIDINGVSGLEYQNDLSLHSRVTWRVHFDGIVTLTRKIAELGSEKGDVVVLETKTASDLDRNFRTRMFSDQAIGYSHQATALLGQDKPVPILFNGLSTRRSALKAYMDKDYADNYRQKYKKEPPALFHRELVAIKPWQHTEWKANVLQDTRRLISDIEKDEFSRNAPDSCTVFGGLCQFSQLCQEQPNARLALADLLYDEDDWKGWVIEWSE